MWLDRPLPVHFNPGQLSIETNQPVDRCLKERNRFNAGGPGTERKHPQNCSAERGPLPGRSGLGIRGVTNEHER